MIVKEFYRTRKDGVKLYRYFSNQNLVMEQLPTGIEYDEAIDVENAPYTYKETDKLVSLPEKEALEAEIIVNNLEETNNG